MNDRVEHDQEAARRAALAAVEKERRNEAMRATGPLSQLPPAEQAVVVAEIIKIVGPKVLAEALRMQVEAEAREKEERKRAEEFHRLRKKQMASITEWFPRLYPYYSIRDYGQELDDNLKKEPLKNIVEFRNRILQTNAEVLGFTPNLKTQALTHLNSVIDARRAQGEIESHSVADSLSLLRKVSNVFRGR